MKITVEETSGATFTSYKPFETTTESLIENGHEITDEQIEKLKRGELVVLYSYNRVGTRTSRLLKAIK